MVTKWTVVAYNITNKGKFNIRKQQDFVSAKEHLEKNLIAAPKAKDIQAVKRKISELEIKGKLRGY